MASNSPSLKRGKHKLEPISIDELAGDSTMTGFSDLFKIPTGVQQPRTAKGWKHSSEIIPNRFEEGGARTGPPKTGPLVSRLEAVPFSDGEFPAQPKGFLNYPAETTLPEKGGPETAPPVPTPLLSSTTSDHGPLDVKTGGVEPAPPETGPPVSLQTFQLLYAPLQRKLQIREAKLVQEGHTYGEQTVYEALWKHGAVVSEQVRVITIGFLRMASMAGLAESNCKAAVAGLLDKLTIERLPDKNIVQGRTYKVYNWTSVLSRRRAAGLTHVIKSRGVIFVDPKTGRHLTVPKTLPRRHGKTSGVETRRPETGGSVSTETSEEDSLAKFHRETTQLPAPDQTSTRAGPQERSPLQSEIGPLACRLRKELDSAFDDSAAGRLWRECQTSVPDCTLDEVMHFVVLKSQKIYRDRNIRNPIGLLLMSIPEFFTGTAVHELRAEKRREEEQRRESQVQQRKYWKQVADDPNTPLDERELALKFLAEIE